MTRYLRSPAAAGWALALALTAVLTGARGIDLAAATYRVSLFNQHGFTLWDSQWYGGHWLLSYSVLFAPLASPAGVAATEVVCAAAAAWAFYQLAVARFGEAGRVGAFVFATGTLVPVVIGQAPYLLGEMLALLALLAATRRYWMLVLALAATASLTSPLAGAFLALTAGVWFVGFWPARTWGALALAMAAIVPVISVLLLFPGQGSEPFAAASFGIILVGTVAFGAGAVLARDRALAIGAALYSLAIIFAYVVPSPLGSNVTRLGGSFGAALAVTLIWKARRARLLLGIALVPLLLFQWGPAARSLLGSASDLGTSQAYYRPLLRFLGRNDVPLGRVEVVPTFQHWEAVYVALRFPLARGWERQLDTADNPLFYLQGRLTSSSYRAWLLSNGVRFVALPDAQLDGAGQAEALLVRTGVPGLRLVWRNPHWRVYAVADSPGILSGPGRLLSANGGKVVLSAASPGSFLVHEHYTSAWQVSGGSATVTRSAAGWLRVTVTQPGRVTLQVGIL